jgi:ABC-2 type transport system ATP-binding protein
MPSNAQPRLSIEHLSKRFGDLKAVHDASLEIRAGEIVGLLGPNGAGKSTLLACVAGLIPADAGSISLDGNPLSPERRRHALFYLPDAIAPWADQPAGWVLDFGARVLGGDARWRETLSPALDLEGPSRQLLGKLSKGQRKRVLLALALLAPQPILLFDEPFDGLDLRQTREAIALFRRVSAAGRSLLLSIHSMRDAERVCDRLSLLSDGKVIATGTVAELRARAGMPEGELEEVFLALA